MGGWGVDGGAIGGGIEGGGRNALAGCRACGEAAPSAASVPAPPLTRCTAAPPPLLYRCTAVPLGPQYMVVDLNKFTPGEDLQPGLLWVAEQIPGLVVAADMTPALALGYWPSFNVPYFAEVCVVRWWGPGAGACCSVLLLPPAAQWAGGLAQAEVSPGAASAD